MRGRVQRTLVEGVFDTCDLRTETPLGLILPTKHTERCSLIWKSLPDRNIEIRCGHYIFHPAKEVPTDITSENFHCFGSKLQWGTGGQTGVVDFQGGLRVKTI